MLYLAGAIVFSSWLTIAFKIAGRMGISTFQAIIFNYFTCVATGLFLDGSVPDLRSVIGAAWAPWALLMGCMFISIFNLIAYTTRKSGVAIASVANKLSLVIPFLFSIFLYNESATILKITGVFIAIVAVFLTCMPSNSSSGETKIKTGFLLLPFLLFISSGLLDTLIKYAEVTFINESNHNLYIISSFGTAGIIGASILAGMLIIGKMPFDPRSIIAGMLIGVPNYFSLWCLVRVLKLHAGNSSSIIPITNMGIVLLSTLVAALFFQEKLSKLNLLGILLSIMAICMIAFG
jgi:drug/metabolite transporter (DMT)-like permease